MKRLLLLIGLVFCVQLYAVVEPFLDSDSDSELTTEQHEINNEDQNRFFV